MRRSRLPALFLSLLFLLSPVACQGQASFEIAGVIVNAQTGAALANARVAALVTGTSRIVGNMVTGANGRFSFHLAAGKYNLHGGPRDAVELYGRVLDGQLGSSIIVGPGLNTSNLTFRWYPVGAITGKVVDETGDPVEGALVHLLRSTMSGGRRVTSPFTSARTNDRGEYRFGRLLSGTYYVAVSGAPWYAQNAVRTLGPLAVPMAVPMAADSPLNRVAFRSVYYPNSPTPEHAAPLVLESAGELRADFSLQPAPGATVRVTTNPMPQRATLSLMAPGLGISDGFERQISYVGKGQALPSVPPGHYTARVSGFVGDTAVLGQQTIDVNGVDTQVDLVLRPLPSVSGIVQFKSTNTQGSAASRLVLASLDGRGNPSGPIQRDGSFSVLNVTPGKYRIAVSGGYVATALEVTGTSFHDSVLELNLDERAFLTVSASSDVGQIKGLVVRDEQPVEAAMAVLVSVREGPGAPLPHGFQTDSDGSFDYQNIPAGDYFLLASGDTLFEYSNLEAIRPYLATAKRIHLESHATLSERIAIAEIPVK